MKLILHGELKERYGDSVQIQAKTVADAIEGFSRQAPDFPTDMLIEAVGFNTEAKLLDETDKEEVHLIPGMFGGSGIGKILVGIAMIGLVILGPGLGLTLSGAILGTGIGLVLSGVMQLFMKAPTISKSEDPEASKYLGSGKNTVNSGAPVQLAWGRVRLYPHWLFIQVNANNLVHGTFPASPT